MAFYATLRDYRFDFDNDDIRGTRVFDRSERVDLGAIHDVIIDRDAWHIDYVVVDGADRLLLLPANRLHPSGGLRSRVGPRRVRKSAGLRHAGIGRSRPVERHANRVR